MLRIRTLLMAATALILTAPPSQAALFTGSGVWNSQSHSASVDFSIVAGQLQVLLINTSTADASEPADMLTGVFFNIASDPAFTSISAVLGTGSTVVNGSTPADGVVGGEWAYLNNLSGAPHGANQGISSSGLGLFGGPTFPGSDLAGPPGGAVDGLQYGITSAGDDPTTNNGGASVPLIKNAVKFTLGNVPLNFDPAAFITDVSFQYGTGLAEPNITASCTSCGPGGGGSNVGVPEPASLALLASGVLMLLMRRKRRA
jgi:hypothetical protein